MSGPGGFLPGLNDIYQKSLGALSPQLPPGFAEDLKGIQAIIPPRYQQVGNGIFFDPSTGSFYIPEKNFGGQPTQSLDADGNIVTTPAGGWKLRKLTAAEAKYNGLDAYGGGGGSAGTRLSTDDPRYWQLQYDQLSSNEKIAAMQTQAQLINAGLDAESARRQALATIITNRNNNAVNLAQTSGDIAAKAAQFAANPRDAFADLNYRNAVGGATPYGSMANPAGAQLQNDLEKRFQELFGGVGGDLMKAREFISSIPPREYLSPEDRSSLGLPPTPQAMTLGAGPQAPAPASAPPPNPLASLMGATPEQEAYYRQVEGNRQMASATPEQTQAIKDIAKARGYSQGGTINFHPFDMGGDITATPPPGIVRGYRPPTSEGGTNLTIHEPSMVVGAHSGHVYATLSEHNPEQMIIKPLPSVQRAQREQDQSGKKFMKATQGAKRNDRGGQITGIPQASQFLDALKQNLRPLGGVGGGTSQTIDPNTGLPALREFAGAPVNAMSPTQYQYFLAAQSRAGVSPEEVDWTLKQGTPRGITNNLPRVSFA